MSNKTYITAADPTTVPVDPIRMVQDETNANDVADGQDIEQQTAATTRLHYDDIIFLPRLKRLGIDFPLFTDDMMKQYQQYNVEHFNPFVFLPSVLLLYVMLVVRSGLAGFHTYDGK